LQTPYRQPKYFSIAEKLVLSKWLTLSNSDPGPSADEVVKKHGDQWAEAVAGYIERSLLIVLGASVTVVAGFLSQVWSSASVAFRSELATNLKAMGTLFVTAFTLPTMRFAVELYRYENPKKSRSAFFFWVIFAVVIFSFYTRLIDQLGDIVLKYAKVTG
jgi:hypothetical protein